MVDDFFISVLYKLLFAAVKARLTPCFHDWVPKTLAPDWVEGAVIRQEAAPNNRWEFNPCSSDGKLQRLYVFVAAYFYMSF